MKPDLRMRFLDALILIVGLLCFLVLLTWMQERDAGTQLVELHRAEAKRVTGLLASCLNGKPIVDRKTNTAYFCGKPYEVQL